MSHSFTRSRAVVGGGILAVPLVACFGAPGGAQVPEEPITVKITDTLTKPVFVGATGAEDVLADPEGPGDGIWLAATAVASAGIAG